MSVTDEINVGECCGHYARKLSEEEAAKLAKDTNVVSEFKQLKLEKEAQKNWDLFYKRNSTNFFKDRHWTVREFQELCPGIEKEEVDRGKRILLEVGCGVGNFFFPLIAENVNLFVYACDFSSRAIEFVKKNALYNAEVCHAFVCDITADDLLENVDQQTVDIVSCIFVLSSLHPSTHLKALNNIYKVLRPGGVLLFRDYGLYDQAMLRFAPGHKLMENFYVRQDGTRAYYFSEDTISSLFTGAGFKVESNCYVQRQTVNFKEGINVPRIFVQGKFSKPS